MPYHFQIDATVRRKLGLIEMCLQVRSVVDFGGMWEVDGYYSKQCLVRFGVKHVTMIDAEESENFKADGELRDGIEFMKGDFSEQRFMKTVTRSYDLAIAYDVLPHQIDLRHTISLMLSKTRRFFLIANPVLSEATLRYRNSLILLSGSRSSDLIPFHEKWTRETNYWRNFRSASNVERNLWLWAMSPSFIISLMAGLGWQLVHRELWKARFLQNQKWRMGGFIFSKLK